MKCLGFEPETLHIPFVGNLCEVVDGLLVMACVPSSSQQKTVLIIKPVCKYFCDRPSIGFYNCTIPGLFLFIFVLSTQLTVNVKFLPMTGFELRTSGIGND